MLFIIVFETRKILDNGYVSSDIARVVYIIEINLSDEKGDISVESDVTIFVGRVEMYSVYLF